MVKWLFPETLKRLSTSRVANTYKVNELNHIKVQRNSNLLRVYKEEQSCQRIFLEAFITGFVNY